MATQDILNSISRRVILAAGLGLILTLLAATIVVLAVLRQETFERAEWHLGNLAKVLGEQVSQSVLMLDRLGETTADELRDRFAGRRTFSDRELSDRLRERVRAVPAVRMVAFVDAAGDLVAHGPEPAMAAVNLFDREHFRVHLERRVEGLYVGSPVLGRMAPEWLTVFSRRVEDERGGLGGVLSLAVSRTHFEQLFAAVDLGESGKIFLLRDDGVLLADYPPDEKAQGRSFAQDPLFTAALPASRSGVQRRAGLEDRHRRIIAHERAGNYPIVVVASVTEDFILASWRRDAWRIGLGAAGAISFIAAALFFLMRQLRVSAVLQHDLDETGRRLQGIIQSAMDALITVDGKQNIVLFNAAAERIFRCSAADAIGGPLERFIPERFRAAHHGHVERFGRTGATTRMMGARLDLFGLRADGEEFPIDASISQIAADGDRYYTVILRDITERKAAEEALRRSYNELRELSGAMHDVREAERLRVARELHDELAQWLTALKMDVSWLASRLPRDQAPLVARTEKMKGVVDTTVAAVRRIAADLRPVMLDDLGLVAAVESLLHDLSQRTGIVVGLETDAPDLDFQEPLATALYRMVQEALTNVARHAAATEVRVTIACKDDNLVVQVLDNGRGFDADAAAGGKSYGVLGIQERARTLGGSARIARGDAGGTLVEIVIAAARYRRRSSGG